MKNTHRHILVRRPKDLSAHWAQRIVRRHTAGAKVFGVKLISIDVGTSTRLRIEVDHDADTVPSRWFVKTPSLALKSRLITALPRFLHKEVNFYNSFSTHVPVKLPRILAAESHLGLGSTLVMTDLAEQDFAPGQAGDALTAEQAGQVIEGLARLHGRYWQDTTTLETQRWLNGFSNGMENHMGSLLAVPLMKQGLAAAGARIADRLHRPAIRYARNRRQYMRWLAKGPQTLVHHDCHPGNIFWTQSGPGLLDWQLVRIGEGIGDVAYFLATALEPELRRRHEAELLRRYGQQLSLAGVADLDERVLFDRYRAHLVYPFEAMVVTLGIGGMMHDASNLELIRRTAAAVDDHDSFSRIEA